jgi:hypothetical protein
MSSTGGRNLRAHMVGSIPLPDADAVFRKLAAVLGPYLDRMPDGETGIRQSWIRFLQAALAEHPAIEVADDFPPLEFRQWDGKLVREIPRLRVIPGSAIEPDAFASGYAAMAIESWQIFRELQDAGTITPDVRFQISIPSPIAPTYNNMVPGDRPQVLDALISHFSDEVGGIAAALPNDRIAIQWDVCQEVLAWEGYYDEGSVDFRVETIDALARVSDAVPEPIELGFHLCYGSPLDEHLVQPDDAGIMVEIANALSAAVRRPIQFFHFPVPRSRTDDAYFEPFRNLDIDADADVYLGLVHHDDADGDARRLATARRHVRVDGIATECGMGRGAPERLDALLEAHVRLIENDD